MYNVLNFGLITVVAMATFQAACNNQHFLGTLDADGQCPASTGAPVSVTELPEGTCTNGALSCTLLTQDLCPGGVGAGPLIDWTCNCVGGSWNCLQTSESKSTCLRFDGGIDSGSTLLGDAAAVDGLTTETACDPLTAPAIILGAVVGVGMDASGVLYVDAANGIFVSNNGKLVRQYVSATSQSGSSEFSFSFYAPGDDGASPRTLLVETQGDTASAMALGPGNSRSSLDQSDAGITSLTLTAVDVLSGLVLVNTPNVIAYIGDVGNGDVLLATLPLNQDSTSTDGGLSLFYGPPSNVAQREITTFDESKSGDGTVTFLVGSTPYVLAFGMLQGPDAGPLGTFTLESLTPAASVGLAITVRSPTPTSLPSDLSFTCLR
jgi:hypothetical protein